MRKDKSALKKLFSTGLLKTKPNLSKAPSAHQKRLINKFQDVISGKAAVVKPADPKSYKGLFKVQGDAVVVPRRKGERISMNKKGAIEGTRKVGARTVKSRFQHTPRGEKIKRPTLPTQYAIPFVRGGGDVQWMRFPDYDSLQKFMEGYDYKGWKSYVVSEVAFGRSIEDKLNFEDDEALSELLDEKIGKLKARRHKELLTPNKRSRK